MILRIYLLKKRISIAQFARDIDFQPQYIASIARGDCRAGKKVARVIEKATGGEVNAEALIASFDVSESPKKKRYLSDDNSSRLA